MSTKNDVAAESPEREFIITRVFNAPRDLVWKAYTEAERLMQWWGPKGVTMRVAKLDLRPGGSFHYCYQMPNGNEMWGVFVYREIVAPERLVFTNSFSDAEGNIVRAPFSADWPLEILNTLTFIEHGGQTTLTMRGVPYNATAAEHKTFEDAFASMQQGSKGTLDQLEAYLARA
jgi:uncharacterized protein YndB with AHSA1/START domain